MKLAGSGHIQADNTLLRPIAEQVAGLIVAASVGDVPNWTFISRSLDDEGARAWIGKGAAAGESGQAVRFVMETEGRPVGNVGAQHPYPHDRGIVDTFYLVLPEFHRRGLADAGLKLLNAWVPQVTPDLRRLQRHVIAGSGRVAELAGYQYEGCGVAVTGSSRSDVGGVPA